MTKDEQELYARAIRIFGREAQRLKLIEECAELIQAVAKHSIYATPALGLRKISEEIADVEIMIEQAKLMYRVDTDFDKRFKLQRLADTLNRRITEMSVPSDQF